jgi:Na+-transporting NADH:ubiquinone oxidoreductase subunit F
VFEITLGVLVFTAIVVTLVLVILFARSELVDTGVVEININDERSVPARAGEKLYRALFHAKLFVPSACGGKGTCGQCRIKVLEGGGAVLPTEVMHLSRRDIAHHERLACQVTVKQDLRISIPHEIFGVKKWPCTVRSNRNVSTFIKELVLDLDSDEAMDFRAGGYVQVECGPHEVDFSDLVIDPPFDDDWKRLRRYVSRVRESVTRAYSMANYPGEGNLVILNVRIALPPAGAPPGTPPGAMSSYLFSLRPGDKLDVLAPFGEFFAKKTDAEMVFIGGGAGMAPMRSHILDQLLRLESKRRISFWYGARSRRELFYQDLFDRLAAEHENFSWHVALSEPRPEDQWTGYQGFIHQVVLKHYLEQHADPEDCEFYLCGPTIMIKAVLHILEDLGVPKENVLFDDFGT